MLVGGFRDKPAGLVNENSRTPGRADVEPQKVRGGRVMRPFLIQPEWTGEDQTLALRLDYAGVASTAKPLNKSDRQVLAALEGGPMREADIVVKTGRNRNTIAAACKRLDNADRIDPQGVVERSQVWIALSPMIPGDS